jgi:16S rRNA (cytosine1402-N4)-methyltransferase
MNNGQAIGNGSSSPRRLGGSTTPAAQQQHKRRPRYSGKYPRRFSEKYKEHGKHPDTLEKVIASGKTPAGTHRPIMVREVLEALDPRPGHLVVDATLGFGGHASEILPRILPGGRLIALDTDPIELPKTETRLRAAGLGPDVLTIVHSNFAGLARVLAAQGVPGADVILADLGLSSMQIDNPDRGFTWKFDGPLDFRMNPNKGRSAAQLLAALNAEELETLLRDNADEPEACLLANAILQAQAQQPITTTRRLQEVIRNAGRRRSAVPTRDCDSVSNLAVRRVFQALRIEVNDEFGALETFLRFLPHCLNPGGKAAILTFHSGEDRRVKRFFREGLQRGDYDEVSEEAIRPQPEETRANPRSAPAKLRWARRAE